MSSLISRLALTMHHRVQTRLSLRFACWGDLLIGDAHSHALAIIKSRAQA
ncbi:MAG: hypothetical protein AAFZ11_04670 [Pseudomonadota bacterium]